MARQLSPRQEEALLLMQVRASEYCEWQGVATPEIRFRPDEFDGCTRAHYQAKGIKQVRADHTITVFDLVFAYDDAERERVLAHELLHYFEQLLLEADIAAGKTFKEAFISNITHTVVQVNRRGRQVAVGNAHGQHHPAFYRKLDQLIADMAKVRAA